MKTNDETKKGSRKKWIITIIIITLIMISVSYVIFNIPISKSPVDVKILQEDADRYAHKWSLDAKLVGLYGGEYDEDLLQDLHPANEYRFICPKDTEKNDGKCYYWTFFYFSEFKVKLYTFGINGNREILFHGNSYHALRSANFEKLSIDYYKPSPMVAKVAKDSGGQQILNEYPEADVFYYLYTNDTGAVTWTVYYSYNGSILGTFDINGTSGQFIGNDRSFISVPSDEYKTTAYELARTWKHDAKLFALEGVESNLWRDTGFSVPEIEFGVIVPPDRKPADGLCPLWVYKYISNQTFDILKVYYWSAGWIVVEELDIEAKDAINRLTYDLVSNRTFLGSRTVINAVNDNYTFFDHRPFMNYELVHYESNFNNYGIFCTWRFNWYESPDCIVGLVINPYNSTILDRP